MPAVHRQPFRWRSMPGGLAWGLHIYTSTRVYRTSAHILPYVTAYTFSRSIFTLLQHVQYNGVGEIPQQQTLLFRQVISMSDIAKKWSPRQYRWKSLRRANLCFIMFYKRTKSGIACGGTTSRCGTPSSGHVVPQHATVDFGTHMGTRCNNPYIFSGLQTFFVQRRARAFRSLSALAATLLPG
jgi:hypothetical protein